MKRTLFVAGPRTVKRIAVALGLAVLLAGPPPTAWARTDEAGGHHRNRASTRHQNRSAASTLASGSAIDLSLNHSRFGLRAGDGHRQHRHGHRSYGHATRSHVCTGFWRRQWVPPRYQVIYTGCGVRRVRLGCGYYRRVWITSCGCNRQRY